MFIAAFALSLALIQDPATSAAQTEAPMTEEQRREAEEEAHLNEVICRREHVVGSNRPQRICQTRRQWNHIQDMSREALRDDRFSTGQGAGAGEGMGGGR